MQTPALYRAAVFDMDGLLLDSERPLLDAWVDCARELGCPFEPSLLTRVLGRPGAEGVAAFRAALGPDFPYEDVRARVRVVLALAHERGFAVMPGVVALLERCRAAGLPCAVASSTRRVQLEERLTSAGLHGYFAAFAGGDEVVHGKPAPDIFLLAAERMRVAAAHCLVFEDSEHGARGASLAGMGVVIVPDLAQPGDEARAFCTAVLPSLEHADGLFTRWFDAPG